MIPPVTQTQSRTVPPVAVPSAKIHEQVVGAANFVPRMTIMQSSAVAAQQSSKPKRYSTQRQRVAADADIPGDMPYDARNADMPPVDTTYYGTQQQQQQPFNGRLSGTTRVGRYQKKHSPAHTHPGQRTSFITFLHLQRSTASSLFSLRA